MSEVKDKLGIDSKFPVGTTERSVMDAKIIFDIPDNTPAEELINIGMFIEMMRVKFSY